MYNTDILNLFVNVWITACNDPYNVLETNRKVVALSFMRSISLSVQPQVRESKL
jgi:hypothetical protein